MYLPVRVLPGYKAKKVPLVVFRFFGDLLETSIYHAKLLHQFYWPFYVVKQKNHFSFIYVHKKTHLNTVIYDQDEPIKIILKSPQLIFKLNDSLQAFYISGNIKKIQNVQIRNLDDTYKGLYFEIKPTIPNAINITTPFTPSGRLENQILQGDINDYS